MTSTSATDSFSGSIALPPDTPLMMWQVSAQGACTYCSPAWLRFTGRSLAQELGIGWIESVHVEDRGACESEFRQALWARRGFTTRLRIRRADGVYRTVVTIGAPRFGARGDLEGFDGTALDVTEQATADGNLTGTEDRLGLHADYTEEIVYRIRLHPRREVEYLSASVHRVTGHPPAAYYDLYRRPELANDLFVPEDRDTVLALLADPEGGSPVVVLRWKHADGRTIWMEHRRTLIRDEAGAPVAIVGVAKDITRQKMLEQQERQHAGLLFALVAHSDAKLVEGPDGQTILTNPAFGALFGETGPEPAREPSPDPERVDHIRRSGVPFWERVSWPDGRVIRREYVPVRSEQTLVAHMWLYVDVTAAVNKEQAWIDSKTRLRELAAHAEKVRETERRQLGRMLHDDIGQALTTIRLEFVTVAARFRQTAIPEQIDLVDRLQNAAGLIDTSLATLRRISTSLRPPVLDHLGLISAMEWEAAEFARRWNIRCRVTTLPRDLELDRERSTAVYRILLEALNNVGRHSQAGAVRIALLRRPGALLLKIEDNGRGISPEQAANPRTMGLLGMRERALPFGGDVRVGSAPRGGTRVLAIFPL
jgi:PAS domain S-box-containing protein